MNFVLKLIQIDDSIGVILPQEVLATLNVGKDDAIQLIEMREGFLMIRHDSALTEQLAMGRNFMDEFCDAFRELAR